MLKLSWVGAGLRLGLHVTRWCYSARVRVTESG